MFPLSAALLIIALIITSGIFTLFDYAFGSCQKTCLEKEKGRLYRAVIKEMGNPQKLSLACRLWTCILRITASLITGIAIIHGFFKINIINTTIVITILVCVLLLSIVTLLIGDGLPKLLSGIYPEKITVFLLIPLKFFYILLIPAILPILKLFNFIRSALHLELIENKITEDELHNVLLKGVKSGIVESNERTMVESVFYLGDRAVGAFMTHRSEILWLDVNAPYEKIKEKALKHKDQRCFPVVDGSIDEIAGAVYLEDIILDISQPSPKGLRAIMKRAQFIPETMSALKAFASFKQGEANFLFVMDEYGGLAGVISIRALIEEIVGDLSAPFQKEEPFIKQEDGSFIADGTLNIDDAANILSLSGMNAEGDFHTLAGFVLFLAGELPSAGESYFYQSYRFTVIEMNGNRIDKILIDKEPD
jgi:putative hemolysin